jgi:UDP-N-acetyl-D-glucosamine dehydrogenase
MHCEVLKQKIDSRTAQVVVVGIGYVGLPLIVSFARAGFHVTGYDKDPVKVEKLKRGESYIEDIPSEALELFVREGKLTSSTNPSVLRQADAVIVCVPTPLNKTKDPDMRFIAAAVDEIAQHLHKGMLVVLESTTYPGTTRELLVPRLTGALTAGEDIFIAFSPERVDPGNKIYLTNNTPKVVGGTTPSCLSAATSLYSTIIDQIVPVSSTDTAEMVKLLENTFRAVNIGLANEVALMSSRLGIDPYEVIRAAATKPFGYMPFYPGPGLGGHCIPIDPLYLSWKLRALKFQSRFIELADAINTEMPRHVVSRVVLALNRRSKSVRGSRVVILGVAYKRDVADVRESPALDVIEGLHELGAKLSYIDPFVPEVEEGDCAMRSLPLDEDLSDYDAVVVVTDHSAFDWDRILAQAPVIIDTRDALKNARGDRSKVIGL